LPQNSDGMFSSVGMSHETLGLETSGSQDRDETKTFMSQDRDETETLKKTSRDRLETKTFETETTSLVQNTNSKPGSAFRMVELLPVNGAN
jgi:hypothetical protein